LLSLKNNVDLELIKIIKNNFKKGSKILEISCGNGEDSLYLQKLGYNIICTEMDDNYVSNAISKGLNCIKHDTRNPFPFPDNNFDLVYSRLGLHYFNEEELNSIFKELKRISNSILLTVKIMEDENFYKSKKIILSVDNWENIINRYFNIEMLNVKYGELYGKEAKWLEVLAK
ncbi:MAG: class I SAM-dependent methyltransferase, partial [bacterium]